MKKQIVVLIIFYSISSAFSWAWGYDGEVHLLLNKEATDSSQILDLFLKDNFGYPLGTNTVLKKDGKEKTIKDWVAYGGEAEDFGWLGKYDFPRTRAYNHFHDPLKEWDAAAFDNAQSLVYTANYFRDPVSAILWGLKHVEQDFLMNLTGDWSWGMAREYYYIYLTGKDFWGDVIASTQDEREANFADSFRSLGQVMHLLQDMSVPLHTRNDLHVFPIAGAGRWTYETYTKKNKNALNYSAHPPDPVLLSDPQPDPAYGDIVPISGLFDRNQYNGDSIPADNNIIGLAEYSNANFLTEDTMWTYPHPILSDTNANNIVWLTPEQVVAEDGNTDNRLYIRKTQGEQIHHLAAVDYWTADYAGHLQVFYEPFILDEECWKEYASKLIPRAVGYSAALLDYFFRGSLEVSTCVPFIYDNKIVSLDFKAKNVTTTEETMSEGNFTVVVRYTPVGGNPDGRDDKFFRAEDVYCNELQYEDELEFTVDLPLPGSEDSISFDVYESIKCYLVFKGTLGAEEGAVIGKVFTLGQIKFREDWDNGLYGNHDWEHGQSGTEPVEGGETKNNITTDNNQDTLIKENIRNTGVEDGRSNQSALILDGNGILITPNTFLHFKIDNISVSPPSTIYLQALRIQFANGTWLQFCPNGQCDYPIDINWPPMDLNIIIDPENSLVAVNIHQLFQEAGIDLPEYLYLRYMNFIQLFEDGSVPETTTQRMEIDFIRIVEETP